MVEEKNKKILIIEDEKPMARALELKLTHEGFEAKSAPNGESALEVLKKETFNLIICDLVMPKMNGFQVLEEMNIWKIGVDALIK